MTYLRVSKNPSSAIIILGESHFFEFLPLYSILTLQQIFHHWVGLVADNEDVPDSFRHMVEEKVAFLYADDRLIVSTNQVWLQWGLDVPIGLFGRLMLSTNVANTVAMLCQPGTISGRKFAVAHFLKINVEGDPHHMRQWQRVVYGECGPELATTSMDFHPQNQLGWSGQSRPLPPPLNLPTST